MITLASEACAGGGGMGYNPLLLPTADMLLHHPKPRPATPNTTTTSLLLLLFLHNPTQLYVAR